MRNIQTIVQFNQLGVSMCPKSIAPWRIQFPVVSTDTHKYICSDFYDGLAAAYVRAHFIKSININPKRQLLRIIITCTCGNINYQSNGTTQKRAANISYSYTQTFNIMGTNAG